MLIGTPRPRLNVFSHVPPRSGLASDPKGLGSRLVEIGHVPLNDVMGPLRRGQQGSLNPA